MIPPTPSPVKQAKSSDVFLPEQLSLPQIHKISIRNIYTKTLDKILSSNNNNNNSNSKIVALTKLEWYFEFYDSTSTNLLYRSVNIKNTLNPEWNLPIEFTKDQQLCKYNVVQFIVYLKKQQDDNVLEKVFEETIDMKTLIPLNLKSLVSFYRLPLNSYMFQLGQCGYFVTPKFANVLSKSSGLNLVQPETYENRKLLTKPQIKYVLGSMIETEKIIQQTKIERTSLEKQIQILLDEYKSKRYNNNNNNNTNQQDIDVAIIQQQKSNEELKLLLKNMENAYAEEKKNIDLKGKRIEKRFKSLQENSNNFKEQYINIHANETDDVLSTEEITLVEDKEKKKDKNSIEVLKKQFKTAAFKCKIREVKIIVELKRIYPIVELTGHREHIYSIRGLQLPGKDLRSYEEDQISTALGYICHLVLLLSDFFDINLRYEPVHRGSRSFIRDNFAANHISPTTTTNTNTVAINMDYPLFWSGVDRNRFDIAVRYLEHDIDRLLLKRNVILQNGRMHMLAKLLKLFDKELGI